ncbi:MAG: hypothetical protein KR126chlam1_01128 [Chlamydiae bacterium]|nr:hypothetical protein [Chlamydiota bacterium]
MTMRMKKSFSPLFQNFFRESGGIFSRQALYSTSRTFCKFVSISVLCLTKKFAAISLLKLSKQRTRRPFTLLEIALCIAILSMVASVLGLQIRNMVTAHYFQKSVDSLLTDLRKLQIIALSDRSDLTLKINCQDGKYSYEVMSDDPIPCLLPKKGSLQGVKKISFSKKRIRSSLELKIFSSGRVEPKGVLSFYPDEKDKPLFIDTGGPLRILRTLAMQT